MFNTTEDFGQYLQNLIDRHREDLSILLQKHGYDNIEPTPALLVLLFNEYGREFVEELATISNFEGDDDLLHAEGSNLSSKLSTVFTKGAALLGKVKTVAGKIAGNKSSGGATAKPATETPEKDSKDNKTKKIIITGVIVVVVLVIIFIIVKNRKK